MTYKFINYDFVKYTPDESLRRAEEYYELLNKRRTVRQFSDEKVDIKLIEYAIRTAGTAPSGANKQPWKFVVVESPLIKKQIREAAEKEEKQSYERRMPQSWLDDLAPLGTDWHKEFLEIAPYIIVVFKIDYVKDDAILKKHYYVNESVGIAVGMLLSALQNLGLSTLTHTPSPMNFLQKILNKPFNEKPYIVIPVGYPASNALIPDINRKKLEEIMEKI